MYFSNPWAYESEKKNKGKTHFVKGVGAALIIAAASLAAFTGCPQNGNGIERPAEPIHIYRDGIDFRTRGEFTIAQAAAITDIINNLDLAAFVGYVHSLTITSEGTLSITLTETDKAVIHTSEITRDGIIAALTAGRDAAHAAQNPYIPTPGIYTNIGGIYFRTADGADFSGEQLAAIQTRIGELDEEAVAAFASFVERVTFGQGLEDGLVIDVDYTAGETATAVIYIDYDAGAEAIMNALADAKTKVETVREAARDETFWTVTEPNPTNFTHGGVNFGIASNLLTRAEIRDIRTMVEGMAVAEFAGFVIGVEFARNVPDDLRIVRGNGEQATASITYRAQHECCRA